MAYRKLKQPGRFLFDFPGANFEGTLLANINVADLQVDIGMVFKLMFGGGAFDEFFGDVCELPLLKQMMSSMEDQMNGSTIDDEKQMMKQRDELKKNEDIYCKQLANKLLTRLERCAKEGDKAFAEQCQKEAQELCEAPGGAELLGMMGYVYAQEGRQYGGRFLGLEGLFAQVQEKAHVVSTGAAVLFDAVRTAKMAQTMDGPAAAAAGRSEEQQASFPPPLPRSIRV
jgi:hypothetical protein